MKIKKALQILAIVICSAFFSQLTVAVPAKLSAHTYHTSLTRIDYNAEQKLYEITIQLFTHDLIPLLEKRTGKNVDFDKKDSDSNILDYLSQNFILTDDIGKTKKLKWVGKEIDTDTIWIYVETSAAEGLEKYQLQNTIFFESFPEQTNLVICHYDGKKADLLFKAGDKTKIISAK